MPPGTWSTWRRPGSTCSWPRNARRTCASLPPAKRRIPFRQADATGSDPFPAGKGSDPSQGKAGIHPPYGDRRARIAHRGDDRGVRVPLPANNAYAMSTTSIASIREEIASALTHGLGAVFALAASAVLITLAAIYGDGWQLASAIVFGIALLLLYTASTLYPAMQHPVAKGRLKVFDHCAIYVLIAG